MIKGIKKIKDLKFFSRRKDPANVWQRIAWWEMRRLPYNLIVGVAGIASLIVILVSAAVAERIAGLPMGMPDPPIFALVGILIYGILANVCYTGGWIAELLAVKVWEEAGKSFGVISFTLGLGFSVLLTLFIGAFFFFLNLLQIILYLSGSPSIE